jgi:hypothetical protein
LQIAERQRIICMAEGLTLLGEVKRLAFYERTDGRLTTLGTRVIGAQRITDFLAVLRSPEADQKRLDAEELIARVVEVQRGLPAQADAS